MTDPKDDSTNNPGTPSQAEGEDDPGSTAEAGEAHTPDQAEDDSEKE